MVYQELCASPLGMLFTQAGSIIWDRLHPFSSLVKCCQVLGSPCSGFQRWLVTWVKYISDSRMGGNEVVKLKPIGEHRGQLSDTLCRQILDQLDRPGTELDLDTYASLLQWCGKVKSLMDGKCVHAHIVNIGLEHDNLLAHLLVQMYGRCGAVKKAQAVFRNMRQRTVYSWNIMIKVYVQNQQRKEALQLFKQMETEQVKPDRVTFLTILPIFTSQDALGEAKQIHLRIVTDGFESDVVMGTALINMYGKHGDLENARRMFDKVSRRDVVSWNSMIAVYSQHGKDKEALELFHQMQWSGVLPNKITFVCTLAACACQGDLAQGQQMHSHIMDCGFESDLVLGTAVVNMYGKCGSPDDARRVFDKMSVWDLVAWNALIEVYAEHSLLKEAIQLFDHMQQAGVMPDKITFVSVVHACANQAALAEGKRMHICIVGRNFQSDIVVGTALVNMYGKSGNLKCAQKAFDDMVEQDVVLWNAMLAACVQHEQGNCVHQFFTRMQCEGILPCDVTFISVLSACTGRTTLAKGEQLHACIMGSEFKSDLVLGNALVNMYGKCGSLVDAQKIFDRLVDRDVVSWNAIIAAYAQNEQGEEALQLFEQMLQQGSVPDKITCVGILDACSSLAALAKGRLIHSSVMVNDFICDIFVVTAVVNMYSKCGCLKDAQKVFDNIQKQTVISWNAMIAAYAQHGWGKETLEQFHQMKQGVMPDKVTFIIVLSACSHAGLVEEACQLFSSMKKDYCIIPSKDHYACMIDLLGRIGWLDAAENLLKYVPHKESAVLYMTLLGACRYQIDVERGERAANQVFELDQEDAAPYVMLSNIYAAAGRAMDAAKIMSKMQERRLKQKSVYGLVKDEDLFQAEVCLGLG